MAEEKVNKKNGIPKILKEVIKNELKHAEIIKLLVKKKPCPSRS